MRYDIGTRERSKLGVPVPTAHACAIDVVCGNVMFIGGGGGVDIGVPVMNAGMNMP